MAVRRDWEYMVMPLAKWVLMATVVLLMAWRGGGATELGWQARIHLNPGVLDAWEVPLGVRDDRVGVADHPDLPGYRSLTLTAKAGEPGGTAVTLAGTWGLGRGLRRLHFEQTRLQIDSERNAVLLLDHRGRPWLIADMPHRQPGPKLDWRHMNLRLLPAAATRLGRPAMAEEVIGSLDLRAPHALEPKGSRNCRNELLWPSTAAPADIALINIGRLAMQRCAGCAEGSTDGRVVVAPDATLLNVGASDVPWYVQFTPPQPPYDNDQHPLLVWAFYRIDADGSLHALGISGVKHAFFAQNDMCDCQGDNILFRNCSDLYSAATNDSGSVLGPRRDIAPRTATWGRCDSVFDRNCDGQRDASGTLPADGFDRRLVVRESAMLPALHPGSTFWIEAWYIVRDDSNLDNSFAHRQVTPSKFGSAWTFPLVAGASTEPGPLINRWVDPQASGPGRRSVRIDTADGRLQLAVRVDKRDDGRFHYRYALMNLDYADARFSGALPNDLRLDNQFGVRGVHFTVAADAVSDLAWRDDDEDPGNDWQLLPGPSLSLAGPQPEGLGWGRLGTLDFISDHPPESGPVRLSLGESGELAVNSLVPPPPDRVFRGDFEAGLD